MGVLQTGEIFCQVLAHFIFEKKLQVHMVLSGDSEIVWR